MAIVFLNLISIIFGSVVENCMGQAGSEWLGVGWLGRDGLGWIRFSRIGPGQCSGSDCVKGR